MTRLITYPERPPKDVVTVARQIANEVDAEKVRVEDAVNMRWFIRVEGNMDVGEDSVDQQYDIVEDIVGDGPETVSKHYNVGADGEQYLIRVEY